MSNPVLEYAEKNSAKQLGMRFTDIPSLQLHFPGLVCSRLQVRICHGAAAGGNIELARMRHVCSALFEDLGGELNLHTSMVDDEGREV
jgi:hypothetical protein